MTMRHEANQRVPSASRLPAHIRVAASVVVWSAAWSTTLCAQAAARSQPADTVNGVVMADPYRWLEQVDSDSVRRWVRHQDSVTVRYLATLPTRAAVAARLREYAVAERLTAPQPRASGLFVARVASGAPTYAIEVVDSAGANRRTIATVAAFPGAGTAGWLASPAGDRVAFAEGAARSVAWRIVDVATGSRLPDSLTGIGPTRTALAWAPDARALYYLPAVVGDTLVVARHLLGTEQRTDSVLMRVEAPNAVGRVIVSEDGADLVLHIAPEGGGSNRLLIRELGAGGRTVDLSARAAATYQFLGGSPRGWWVLTTNAAPRGRIVEIDRRNPDPAHWNEVVPQGAQAIMTAQRVGSRFVVTYSDAAVPAPKIFSGAGKFERSAPLPAVGTMWDPALSAPGLSAGPRDPVAYYTFLTANRIASVYRLDTRTGRSTVFSSPSARFRPEDYTVTRVLYAARDGTRIPLFLAHRKNLKLDGTAPVVLDAVAAPGVSSLSFWSATPFAFMEAGGIYAMAGVRGGEEHGEEWRRAGSAERKATAIDDYLAAIEWLVASKYTSAGRVGALSAGSAAAIVAAAVNQHPEFFGAVLMGSAFTDIVRLEQLGRGSAWTETLGSFTGSEQAAKLLEWSPYHNVRRACYPPMIVTANELDESAHPAHSYKYVAALQNAQTCDRPILLQVRWGQGFNIFGANPVEQVSFFFNALGIPVERLAAAGVAARKPG